MNSAHLRKIASAAALALGVGAIPAIALAQHEHHAPPPTEAAAPSQTQHADHAPAPTDPAHADHAQHAQHDANGAHGAPASPVPPPTDEDRAAAFPDLDPHMAHEMHDDPFNKAVLVDRLEARDVDSGSLLDWDVDAWVGRTFSKLWIRTEGERESGDAEHAELELLWGKGFARWWDFVAGARRDFEPGPAQDWAAVGVQGLAPYRFDVAATAYLGDGGRSALRIETTYEVLVTNKLILEPLLEVDWYGQSDTARGVGAGLSDGELGLRLRYEFKREVAPYVGLVRETKFGATADLARARGEDTGDTKLVAGIRLSF